MTKHFYRFFALFILSSGVFAGAELLPWSHSMCFRSSWDDCEPGTIWAYTTDHTASPCGCINKKDLLSENADECDKLGIGRCNVQIGEDFFNLYAAKNRKLRIGCGCFTVQKE